MYKISVITCKKSDIIYNIFKLTFKISNNTEFNKKSCMIYQMSNMYIHILY